MPESPHWESNMRQVNAYHPLNDLLRGFFVRPMDLDSDGTRNLSSTAFRVDVRENENAYFVSADLPGVDKDNIRVDIDGNQLTISAETTAEAPAAGQGEQLLRSERYVGKLSRSFTFPSEMDEQNAEGRSKDGVLSLILPKKVKTNGTRLTIQ